jgi:hypothetical protein
MNVPANSSVRRVGAGPRRAPLRGVAVGVGAVVAMAQVATDVVAHGRLDPLLRRRRLSPASSWARRARYVRSPDR